MSRRRTARRFDPPRRNLSCGPGLFTGSTPARTLAVRYRPELAACAEAVGGAGTRPRWSQRITREAGPAAPGQIAVLGSEPGENDYSPLWQTVIVQWKPGVTPQVLTSDNMILDLAKKGQLTATKTAVIVNATVMPRP